MKLHPQNPTPGTDNPPARAMVSHAVTYTKEYQQTKNAPASYACVVPSGILIGHLEQEVDGFYYFFPIMRGGFWEAYILHDIARKLDALNEAWNQKINDYFDKLDNK